MEAVFVTHTAQRASIPEGAARRLTWPRRCALLPFLLATLCGASAVLAGEPLGNRLAVTKSGIVPNLVSKTFDSTVTITNISTAVIAAPLALAIKNITLAGVSVANSAGIDDYSNPLVPAHLTFGVLRPREKVAIVVKFANPSGGWFDYSVAASGGIISNGAPGSIKPLPGASFYPPR